MSVTLELPHNLPVLGVPHEDGSVSARGIDEPLAAPLDRRHGVGVRGERNLAVPVHGVPDANRPVSARGRGTNRRISNVRGLPRERGDVLLVALHGAADSRAGDGIPQPDVLIHAARGDDPPVGRPRDAEDPVGVALAGMLGGLRLVVPQANGGVAAPAGQVLAVGEKATERTASAWPGMAEEQRVTGRTRNSA